MKKLLLVLFAWLSFAVHAFGVELNTATQAELEALKGVGPVKSKAIVDERTKNGPFKDGDDFANRVKGIGDKTVVSLESQGLTINGASTAPTGTKATSASSSTKKTPGANVKSPAPAMAMAASAPAAAPAPASASAAMTASGAMAASSASGKKSKKASKKAAASAASAASASK